MSFIPYFMGLKIADQNYYLKSLCSFLDPSSLRIGIALLLVVAAVSARVGYGLLDDERLI